ncbi:MAG: MarR family winged helix-turn-helix transcriptional regulator [Pseudomonadota bacterium]
MSSTTNLRLSEFLPYRLSVLSNTISRGIAAIYDEEFGLTIWQWRVMAVLGETAGLAAVDVTERTAMDKVAVSRAVSGLIEEGYVERHAAQGDGRMSLLHLTSAGEDVYKQIVPRATAYEKALLESLSETDLEILHRLLDSLAEKVTPDRKLW